MPNTTDLTFITDDILRDMIFRDINELDLCLKNGLYKSAMILSGSIIEAILVDYFLAFPPPNEKNSKDIKNATLINLIDWASDPSVNLLSDTSRNIATVIREYRNLIHPGVEYRNKLPVDQNKANVAGSLVRIIIDEISKNYIAKLGYSSEQAIRKVDQDPNSRSLFDHMISTMSNVEKIRLYLKIPLINLDDQIYSYDQNEQRKKAFKELHSKLKLYVPLDIKKAEAVKLYKCISEGSVSDILHDSIFFAEDIGFIESDKREPIIDYFLNVLQNNDLSELSEIDNRGIFIAIGKYLNSEDGLKRIKEIVIVRMWDTQVRKDDFLPLIKSIFTDINQDYFDRLVKSLKNYGYKRATEWGEWLEIDDDLPF